MNSKYDGKYIELIRTGHCIGAKAPDRNRALERREGAVLRVTWGQGNPLCLGAGDFLGSHAYVPLHTNL